MSNRGKKPFEKLDNENILQAVIIVDTFSQDLAPFCSYMPPALLPLANHPLLEYTLECLFAAGVQEVILFCSSFAEQIRNFIREEKWPGLVINVVVSEGCRNLGDVMRDLDSKVLIRNDFFLLSGNLVSNLQLLPALENHKRSQKIDKGAVMTLIFKECGSRLKEPDDVFTLAVGCKTNRVLLYCKTFSKMVQDPGKIDFPLELILENPEVDLRCDLQDTQVSICSVAVPPLFSDNFDFQTREDFLRGLLVQDEVLTSTIYAYFLPSDQYAASVTTWGNYQLVTHDVIHRWVYPLVPGMFSDNPYIFKRNNIYTQRNISLSQGCKLQEDVVLDSGTAVGQNSLIARSVIGTNCQIGNCVTIEDAFIMNNVVIKDCCYISNSVVGPSCVINTNATVTQGSVLAENVVIDTGKHVSGVRLQSHPPKSNNFEALSSKAFVFRHISEDDSDSDLESNEIITGLRMSKDDVGVWRDTSESDDSEEVDRSLSPMPEDTNLFYSEVVDSLVRGYDDHLPCDNLMLEINSSRYAYNVTMNEVTVNVVRALLTLPRPGGPVWPNLLCHLTYFTPILTNYIRSETAQRDCLQGIEDICNTHPDILQVSVKIVHWLYDQDILSEDVILHWHQHLPPDVSKENGTKIRAQVASFIKWLKEAEEQSDHSDD